MNWEIALTIAAIYSVGYQVAPTNRQPILNVLAWFWFGFAVFLYVEAA